MNRTVKNVIAQLAFIVAFVTIWQLIFNAEIKPPLIFPSVSMIGNSFVEAFKIRELSGMIMHSFELLLIGLGLGIVLAMIFSSLSAISETFYSIYNMIVSMCDLIPGIALMPVAVTWAGIGDEAIIFMVVHSVIWPMSRSVIDGFNSVPKLYLEVGQNIGLRRAKLVMGVYLPAALPRIISGIKTGWARAWRGLIAAEMVFGGSEKGIGYFIQDRRTNLDMASVFATIIVIILIGAVVEYGIFRFIENKTIKKWGMTR